MSSLVTKCIYKMNSKGTWHLIPAYVLETKGQKRKIPFFTQKELYYFSKSSYKTVDLYDY